MQTLTTRSDGWGSIHGDLHQDNLLFHEDSVRPIDFGDLRLAHFAYDLGVILYHLMYLPDASVQRAIRDGYAAIRPLPNTGLMWPEAFLCAAALSNLSFQATIPDRLVSRHTALNVREFATFYCTSLVSSEPIVFVSPTSPM
jgi:Ser/Thr protein kinase RdoA (MazF antagonist)